MPPEVVSTPTVTAFVLAGGGSLGAIQVGMLRPLTNVGVMPDFVVGSSVGAIHAAYFAGLPTSAGGRLLRDTARRALFVPFRHGYPLDRLGDPVRQHRVLDAALALQPSGPFGDSSLSPIPAVNRIADGLGVELEPRSFS